MSAFEAGSNIEIRRSHLGIFSFIPAWTIGRGKLLLVYERNVELVEEVQRSISIDYRYRGSSRSTGEPPAGRGKTHLDARQKGNAVSVVSGPTVCRRSTGRSTLSQPTQT